MMADEWKASNFNGDATFKAGLIAQDEVDFSGAGPYTPAVEEGWPIHLMPWDFVPRASDGSQPVELVTINTDDFNRHMNFRVIPFLASVNTWAVTTFVVPNNYDGRQLLADISFFTTSGEVGDPVQTVHLHPWAYGTVGHDSNLDFQPAAEVNFRGIEHNYLGKNRRHIVTHDASSHPHVNLTPGELAVFALRRTGGIPEDSLLETIYIDRITLRLAP